MSDEVFNFVLDLPYEEEIEFRTIISESDGGKEQRYQKWLKPRRTFRTSLRARNASETDDLWRFYMRRKGTFDSFLFENSNESPVTGETVGSGDGQRSVFYLGNKVQIGTGDLIVAPGTAVIQRSVGGTGDYLPFSAYTIDEDLGQVTTNSVLPSGDVLKASTYQFYYRVRFKEDNLSREEFAFQLWNHGIDIIEVV